MPLGMVGIEEALGRCSAHHLDNRMFFHGHTASGCVVHSILLRLSFLACGWRVCGTTWGLAQAPVSGIDWEGSRAGVGLLVSFGARPSRERRRAIEQQWQDILAQIKRARR